MLDFLDRHIYSTCETIWSKNKKSSLATGSCADSMMSLWSLLIAQSAASIALMHRVAASLSRERFL